MDYGFGDKYLQVYGNISIELDFRRLKDKLAKAQSSLAHQIIADTSDYVPFEQGILSNSAHTEHDDTEIVYSTPYARFLYMGKLMLDERGSAWAKKGTRKHVVDKNLNYSKEGHSKAGSHWFERAKEDNLKTWEDVVKKAVK